MSEVEYWRSRYRDPKTGEIVRTMFQLTAEEAASPGTQRIESSRAVRDAQDSEETEPAVFYPNVDDGTSRA